MDDPLDNELRNRIREVFDHYEDTSADEGWLLLREKFPEKARRRPAVWLWWASAAAVALLFLGIGLWLANKPVNNNTTAGNKKIKPDSAVILAGTGQPENSNTLKDSIAAKKQQQSLAANGGTGNPAAPNNNLSYLSKLNSTGNSAIVTVNKNNAVINYPQPAATITIQQLQTANTGNDANKNNSAFNADSATSNNNIIANSKALNAAAIAARIKRMADSAETANNTVKPKPKPAVNSPMELFANDNNLRSNTPVEKTKSNDKLVRFSIYAATYFNYAKGSSNQLNAGAGITTDIRLTHNLKFSTGVAIAQNTMAYNRQSQIPVSPSTLSDVAASANLSVYSYKAQGAFLASTPNLKTYDANLVGLDIPMNLKYMFNPDKNDTYVSAGLSSGTFINETYTYNYNVSAPVSSENAQTQGVSTKNNFNGFYFAKTLNFAFGVGYPLGKTNRLIIEPFVKYPLDGVGSQQLKFGAGGLNLKFNFTSPKK